MIRMTPKLSAPSIVYLRRFGMGVCGPLLAALGRGDWPVLRRVGPKGASCRAMHTRGCLRREGVVLELFFAGQATVLEISLVVLCRLQAFVRPHPSLVHGHFHFVHSFADVRDSRGMCKQLITNVPNTLLWKRNGA